MGRRVVDKCFVLSLAFKRKVKESSHKSAGIGYELLVEVGISAAFACGAVHSASRNVSRIDHVCVTYACSDYVVAR